MAGKSGSQADERDSVAGDNSATLPIPKTKWRPGALTLFIGFMVILFLASWVGYSLWKTSLQSQLDAELAKMRERGEPVWFADVRPEPVPDEENGASEYEQACVEFWEAQRAALAGKRPSMNAYLFGVFGAGSGSISQATPAQIAEIRAVVAENPGILSALHRAGEKDVIQLAHDYDTRDPMGILLETVSTSRAFTRLLDAECALAFADGDVDRAWQSVIAQLQLVRALSTEPFFVSQVARAANVGRSMTSIQELLSHTSLADEQFALFDKLLADVEASYRLRDSFLAERSIYLTASTHASRETFALNNSDTPGWKQWAYVNFEALRIGEQLELLQAYSEAAELVDNPSREASSKLDDLRERLKSSNDFGLGNVGSATQLREVSLRTRQNLINARIAIRVARFYHENGQLPSTLEEVTDAALPTIEPGLMLQMPLVYRITSGEEGYGFDLADQGADGLDTQGKPNAAESAHVLSVRFAPQPELVPQSTNDQ